MAGESMTEIAWRDNTTLTNVTLDNITTPDFVAYNDCVPQPVPHWNDTWYSMYRVIVDVFIVGFLIIFGIIGNAVSILVLHKDRDKDKKNTTNWLLQMLAFSDTLYLVACTFFQTFKTLSTYTAWLPVVNKILPYIEPTIWAIASILHTTVVWLVMLVTVDRFVAVCLPLKTNLRTIQRAQKAVGIVVLFAIIYNLPRFFERTLVYKVDHCTNTTVVQSQKTPFRDSTLYFLIYKTIMYFIFRTMGPLLILIILNTKLILALQVVRKKHRNLTKSNKNRENITLVLVAVVTVFIICHVPDLMIRIIFAIFRPTDPDVLLRLRTSNCISNMLLTVNSSINFLIYVLIGKKFRKILWQMCCKRLGTSVIEASESEPLTTRTVTCSKNAKNGAMPASKSGGTDADVQL